MTKATEASSPAVPLWKTVIKDATFLAMLSQYDVMQHDTKREPPLTISMAVTCRQSTRLTHDVHNTEDYNT